MMKNIKALWLIPSLVFSLVGAAHLPASTFGGGTGPRHSVDEDALELPQVAVDGTIYRRTKARLSVDKLAPLALPSGDFVVRQIDELIVEFNRSFVVIPNQN